MANYGYLHLDLKAICFHLQRGRHGLGEGHGSSCVCLISSLPAPCARGWKGRRKLLIEAELKKYTEQLRVPKYTATAGKKRVRTRGKSPRRLRELPCKYKQSPCCWVFPLISKMLRELGRGLVLPPVAGNGSMTRRRCFCEDQVRGKPRPPMALVKMVWDSKQVQNKQEQILWGMFSGSGTKRFLSGARHGGFRGCFEQPKRAWGWNMEIVGVFFPGKQLLSFTSQPERVYGFTTKYCCLSRAFQATVAESFHPCHCLQAPGAQTWLLWKPLGVWGPYFQILLP